MTVRPAAVLIAALLLGSTGAAPPATLKGSPASMERQHRAAVARDYSFASDSAEVAALVAEHRLLPVVAGTFDLAKVSYPFARPQVVAFIQGIASDYERACGERLVVTSLVRPRAEQPGNAHDLSVHPAGMAVDLRISRTPGCREWLEERLLAMEQEGTIDATRERNPPHYHIAVLDPTLKPAANRPPASLSTAEALSGEGTDGMVGAAPSGAAAGADAQPNGGTPLSGLTAAVLLASLMGWALWVAVRR